MGDALIAAAIVFRAPERLALACNSRWHPLLRAAFASVCDNTAGQLHSAAHALTESLPERVQALELLPIDLDYVNRGRAGRTSLGTLPKFSGRSRVLSIRGDVRDYFAARKIFPHAPVRASGWLPFAARRLPLLDLPFARGWLPVRNRYRAWSSITGVPWAEVEQAYRRKLPVPPSPMFTVHVGAQWRSRQYPDVAALVTLLRKSAEVRILAGPGDLLPVGVAEREVRRVVNQELVDVFRASSAVIVNDSGPMHLAATLGCRVYALCRLSSIEEWLPPATVTIRGADMPKGYRPHARYMSDEVLAGWPSPVEVLSKLNGRQTEPRWSLQSAAAGQVGEFPAG